MKNRNKILTIFLATSIFFLVFFSIRLFNPRRYAWRIEQAQIGLHRTRSQLNAFKENEGRYPDTLAELHRNCVENDRGPALTPELFSCEEGSNDESSVLNGKGGWCYNKETGEVKINLTRPLKDYLSCYVGRYRNQAPCEW